MADNLLDKASILLTPTAYNDGSMLSVKPENGDGDFTFSRSSAATRVNAQGLVENVQIISSELVSNGNFSQGGQDWIFGTGWSVGDGVAVADNAPDGERLQQNNVFVSGKTYKVTYEITEISQGGFRGYVGGTNLTTRSAVGTYTETLIAPLNDVFYIRTIQTTSGSITNISVKEITDDTDLPRIDYTDGCGSWLLEPQSTNLYLNSETLATQSNTTSASTYTVSFYGTGTITFSGTHTGTLVGTGANDRVSATFTATAGTLTSTISGTCTKGQLENLSYATSYIPTNGATNTRLQDIANNSGNSTLINSTEGVLYAEIAALANDGIFRIISLTDGSTSNRVSLIYNTTNNFFRIMVVSSGSTVFDISHSVTSTLDFHKVAIKYKANDFAVWIDNVEVATDTSGATPIGLDRITFDVGNSTLNFYGKAKAVAVFKEALTDAELQSLTTQ